MKILLIACFWCRMEGDCWSLPVLPAVRLRLRRLCLCLLLLGWFLWWLICNSVGREVVVLFLSIWRVLACHRRRLFWPSQCWWFHSFCFIVWLVQTNLREFYFYLFFLLLWGCVRRWRGDYHSFWWFWPVDLPRCILRFVFFLWDVLIWFNLYYFDFTFDEFFMQEWDVLSTGEQNSHGRDSH